jgi:hypothetical protein
MKKFILAALVMAPALASAQQLGGIRNLLESIGDLVKIAMPIVVGLALLAFFYGLLMFIFAQADETKKKDAKRVMIWSVVALFVMVSVWGLVDFIRSNLGISNTNTPGSLPQVPNL